MKKEEQRPTQKDKYIAILALQGKKTVRSSFFQRFVFLKMTYPESARTMEWLEQQEVIPPFLGDINRPIDQSKLRQFILL